jgi:hypothetical protein
MAGETKPGGVSDEEWEAQEQARIRDAQASKNPPVIDPYAALRQQTGQEAHREPRIGSTPAQRAGAVPGYASGYGFSSPQNTRKSLTPESIWNDRFPNRAGSASTSKISAIPTHMPAATHMASNAVAAAPASAPAPAAAPQFVSAVPSPAFVSGPYGSYGGLHSQYGEGSSFIPAAGTPAMPPTPTNPLHRIGDEHGDYVQNAQTGAFTPKPIIPPVAARISAIPGI